MRFIYYLSGSMSIDKVEASHKPENYDHVELLEKKYIDDEGTDLDLMFAKGGRHLLPDCLFIGYYED